MAFGVDSGFSWDQAVGGGGWVYFGVAGVEFAYIRSQKTVENGINGKVDGVA